MSAVMETSPLAIRPIVTEDIPAIMEIEERAYASPWTEGIMRDCLRVGYSMRLCERDGEILGYAIMSVAAGEAHILNLCVQPESQGQGIGREILAHMLHLARQLGAGVALLEVRPSNVSALRLYQSFDFDEIGRRKDYYPASEGREDALVLALSLSLVSFTPL